MRTVNDDHNLTVRPVDEGRRSMLRGALGACLFPGAFSRARLSREDIGDGHLRATDSGVLSDVGGFFDVQRTPNDGYLLTGIGARSDDTAVGWAVELDAQLTPRWNRTYLTSQHATSPDVGEYHDAFEFGLPDGDDSRLLVGYAWNESGPDKIGWIVAVDDQGDERWSKRYVSEVVTNSFEFSFADGTRTDDGGYLLVGRTLADAATEETNGDGWVVKINGSGDVEWERLYNPLDESNTSFGEDGHHDEFKAVVPADDGYLLVGEASPDGPSESTTSAGWILHIDSSGNERWERTFRLVEAMDNEFLDVVPSPDGGYVLCGVAGTDERRHIPDGWFSIRSTVGEGWVLKVDADGDRVWELAPGGDGFRGMAAFGDRYLLVGSRGGRGWATAIDGDGSLGSPTHTDGGPESVFTATEATSAGPIVVGWRRPEATGPTNGVHHTLGGENTLVVTKDDEGKAAYLLEATGEVMEGRDSEAIIEGSSAHDHVGLNGTDELRYTGAIANFVMKGNATVIHNGREVDPDSLGWADETDVPCDELTNTLTIESGGRDAGNYAVTVTGGLGYGYGSEAAIRGSSAVDWVGETGGIDTLRYSGRIRTFLLKGHAEVYRNGERVDPDELGR